MPWETDRNTSPNVRDISSARKKKIEDALAEVYDRPGREADLKVDRKDLSEPISFRMSVSQLRLADEIVGQRLDPILKTRTDLIRMALGMFFDAYKAAKKNDKIGKTISPMLSEVELERVKARIESDRRFLTGAEEVVRTGDLSARKSMKKTIDSRIQALEEEGEEDNSDRIGQLKSLRRIYYGE